MITFKQQFTFEETSVKNFAIHLGWKETLTRQITVVDETDEEGNATSSHFETEEYANPETFTEFVDKKAKEHSMGFIKSWAEKLKSDYMDAQIKELRDTAEPQLDLEIIKPVEDALTSEVIEA